MRFIVYRMFHKGQALSHEQAVAAAVLGDLQWHASAYSRGARTARLYNPGTYDELIPILDRPDTDMERSYLKLVGQEIVVIGDKNAKNPNVTRYHQEWRCSAPVSDLRLSLLQVIDLATRDRLVAGG